MPMSCNMVYLQELDFIWMFLAEIGCYLTWYNYSHSHLGFNGVSDDFSKHAFLLRKL